MFVLCPFCLHGIKPDVYGVLHVVSFGLMNRFNVPKSVECVPCEGPVVVVARFFRDTDSLSRPINRHPFSVSAPPTEEYCRDEYGSVRVTPTFFGGGNATRTAPLRTEPTPHPAVETRHNTLPPPYCDKYKHDSIHLLEGDRQ